MKIGHLLDNNAKNLTFSHIPVHRSDFAPLMEIFQKFLLSLPSNHTTYTAISVCEKTLHILPRKHCEKNLSRNFYRVIKEVIG